MANIKKKSIFMQAKVHTHARYTGEFKQVRLTEVTLSTQAECAGFLSPLYSLGYEILERSHNWVIGTLPVASRGGKDVFSLSLFHHGDFKCRPKRPSWELGRGKRSMISAYS